MSLAKFANIAVETPAKHPISAIVKSGLTQSRHRSISPPVTLMESLSSQTREVFRRTSIADSFMWY